MSPHPDKAMHPRSANNDRPRCMVVGLTSKLWRRRGQGVADTTDDLRAVATSALFVPELPTGCRSRPPWKGFPPCGGARTTGFGGSWRAMSWRAVKSGRGKTQSGETLISGVGRTSKLWRRRAQDSAHATHCYEPLPPAFCSPSFVLGCCSCAGGICWLIAKRLWINGERNLGSNINGKLQYSRWDGHPQRLAVIVRLVA